MLRPNIDDDFVGTEYGGFGVGEAGGARVSHRLLPALDAQVAAPRGGTLGQDVVVLARRAPLPLFGQQDARQVGMTLEMNAKHVKSFTLEPIRHAPDSRDAGHRLVLPGMNFQAQAFIFHKGVEVQNNVEAFFALRPVHRGEVGQHVKLLLVAAVLGDFDQLPAVHHQDGLLPIEPCFADGITETASVALHQFIVEGLRLGRRFFGRPSRGLWRHGCGRLRRRSGGGRSPGSGGGPSAPRRVSGGRVFLPGAGAAVLSAGGGGGGVAGAGGTGLGGAAPGPSGFCAVAPGAAGGGAAGGLGGVGAAGLAVAAAGISFLPATASSAGAGFFSITGWARSCQSRSDGNSSSGGSGRACAVGLPSGGGAGGCFSDGSLDMNSECWRLLRISGVERAATSAATET